MTSSKNLLLMFAKYPEPGKVKTRLAKSIGNEQAALVQKKFIQEIVAEHNTNNSAGYDFMICYAPILAKSPFSKLFPSVAFSPQSAGDLGDRLFNAFTHRLKEYDKMVVIGADLPDLTQTDINEAFNALENNDVVFGPTDDGGYYLVALKQAHPIFDNIEWSTEVVLQQSLQLVEKKGLKYHLLRKRQDIDTIKEFEPIKEKYL